MAIDTTEAQLYGIGKGAAQVWGQNRALGMLQQQYQQDQLRRQKEDAEIADQVSKINYDAARNEDLPEILDMYGNIKNTFTKLRGTQNQMDRIKLQTQMNQQKADLARAVNLSKQAGQQLGELGKLRLSKPDDISDDFTGNYKTLSGLSVFDPRFKDLADKTTNTALQPKFDNIGMAKKLAEASIVKQPQSKIQTEQVPGGGTSYFTTSGQKLDKTALTQNVLQEATNNRGMQRNIKQLYPNLPFTDAVKAYTDDLYEGMKGKYDESKRTGASVIKPDDWREKMLFSDKLIRARHAAGISEGIGEPQNISIPFNEGKNFVNANNYVGITTPAKKNFVGTQGAISMSTGKPVPPLASSNEYAIIGVGNFPIINKDVKAGKNVIPKGSLAQGNFAEKNPNSVTPSPMVHVKIPAKGKYDEPEDVLIPLNRLPANIRNSKSIASALSNFKPAATPTSSVKQQSTPVVQSTGKKTIKGF